MRSIFTLKCLIYTPCHLGLYFKFTSINFNLYRYSAEQPESLTNNLFFWQQYINIGNSFSALFQVNYIAFMNSDHHEALYYPSMLLPVFPPVGWLMFSGLVSKTHPPKFNNGANWQSKRHFPNSQPKRESEKRKQEKRSSRLGSERRGQDLTC